MKENSKKKYSCMKPLRFFTCCYWLYSVLNVSIYVCMKGNEVEGYIIVLQVCVGWPILVHLLSESF